MFNISCLDTKFKVMFYALFILMYIISSSNSIRPIGLSDIVEPHPDSLTRKQRMIYNFAMPTTDNLYPILRRQYYLYAMRANEVLFDNFTGNMQIYEYLHTYVMYNEYINNQGILILNQWLEAVNDFHSSLGVYTSALFAQGLNRIPLKPRYLTQNVYVELCISTMNSSIVLYINALNEFFDSYLLPPEVETPQSIEMRIRKQEVFGDFYRMMTCQDISWLQRLYQEQILSCESYLSYTLRTIYIGKIPIPKASIPSIYDVPPDFNPFINYHNFEFRSAGLSQSDRETCVFMFILVNMRN